MESRPKLPPLLVRADADAEHGIGHVMRCLALADAWHTRGGSVGFLSCRPDSRLSRSFEAAGAQTIEIREAHPAGADLCDTVAAMAQSRSATAQLPWIVLDGYHFDPAYQRAVRAAGCRLMVIDDTAHLPYYDADIILNHGAHAPQLLYRCPPESWLLRGSRYALLRREFQRHVQKNKSIARRARKILVTLGGSDPVNATATVVKALQRMDAAELKARVIMGPVNLHVDSVKAIAARSRCPIVLETGGVRLASLMRWADLAITAGGGTCWELAAMGVPMLTLVVADNQRPVAAALEAEGTSVNLGWHEAASAEGIAGAIAELADDFQHRAAMSEKGRTLVDGRGAERVVNAMREKTFLRAA